MEDLEAYDNVVEDIEVKMNKVIEDDVFIDEDVVEGNIQELRDRSSPKGPPHPHM